MSTTALLLLLCVPGQSPAPEDVNATIERALPYIEAKGTEWIDERKCVSCHRVSLMVWSLESAAGHGFSVDAGQLNGWRDWALTALLSPRDDGDLVASRNLEGSSQLLLARQSAAGEVAADSEYAQLASLIVEGQQEDGSWPPGGQLPGQKRPLTETTAVSTMWDALALCVNGGEAADAVREKALAFLQSAPEGESTEWYAAMLLLENACGDDAGTMRRAAELLALQNADGGWGWLVEDESDALGTGEALYALAAVGKAATSEAQRAVRWLVEHQREDGSWAVRGTKEKKRDSIEETAVYMGTCWAVLGLLESRPGTDVAAERAN